MTVPSREKFGTTLHVRPPNFSILYVELATLVDDMVGSRSRQTLGFENALNKDVIQIIDLCQSSVHVLLNVTWDLTQTSFSNLHCR